MIFRMANIGTAKIAPGTPHIQNQNTSDKMTNTGIQREAPREQHGRQCFTLDEMNAKVEHRRQQSPP